MAMIDDLRDSLKRSRSEPMTIGIGRRFVAAQYHKMIWEVVAVSRHFNEPIPHVQMVRVGSPFDTKTVSATVLCDPRFYRAVDEG